ncbi:MAG: hypothetical protein ABSH32_21170 [Bryobacteraceae bacterium]
MSSPVIPPPLQALGNRPFSFYPALLNIEHNKWQYRKATWSDVLVVNSRTGQEIWIPRRFLGEISRIEDPVVIVGLLKELEYRAGAVWPYQRRVIEMPIAVNASAPQPAPARKATLAPVVGIRLESKPDLHIFRLVGGILVVGVVAAYFVVNFYRDAVPRSRISYTVSDQSYLALTAQDDFGAVVRKLGTPVRDRWMTEGGAHQYRALSYPDRAYTIVLMGADRQKAAYIGALDENWNPIHAVEIPGGASADSLLRALPRF